MNSFFKTIVMGAAALLTVQCTTADEKAAQELAQRVVPSLAGHISFVQDRGNDSIDSFTLSGDGDKIVIRGNNAGSMAVGLNYYLKKYCLTEVSWYANEPVTVPDTVPAVDGEITVDARVPDRFFLNYCTFGYTMPWWNWADWERFIDWMALNGVNMPLAITGQEAIWYKVWSKLGLSDEEIRNYFTGPSHLPWHRMCNVDRWQGGLPTGWLDEQAELQKRIVDRERSLSMRPVLQGFAGHVPAELKEKHPDARTTEVSLWGGFPAEYRCTYLSPTDPLFAEIQKDYLTEQTKLYGTDHLYGVDPFNEVEPPTWKADSLAIISRGIYESLVAADPDATWVQMGWLFYNARKRWTPERVKAYLTGVPQGKMILLDYYCERVEEWKLLDKFYGQPYIWCYLGNFGGNTFLASPFANVESRMKDVLANGGSNLAGIGSTLEGFDVNQYMYEFVFENAWNFPATDNIAAIADRRTGRVDAKAREAWRLLADSVLIQNTGCTQGPLLNARPCFEGVTWWTVKPDIKYSNANLIEAWGKLLEVDSCNTDAYRFDVVNFGRQALGNHYLTLRDIFTEAYRAGDIEAARAAAEKMKELAADITTILRGHQSFSLKEWIEDARAKGTDDAQKDYYERNARTLVTIWGPGKNLNDYANRQWAELNESYYAPRWAMFTDDALAALEAGKPFDKDAFYEKSRAFENAWIEPTQQKIEYLEPLDAVEVARQMYTKYAPEILATQAAHAPVSCPIIK